MNCLLIEAGFVTCMVCLAMGHAAGAWAWRDRLPQYSRWQWLADPFYFLRSRYYKDPKAPTRFVAAGLLCVGAILLIALATVLISTQRAGATEICGFKF